MNDIGFYWDNTFILVLIGAAISGLASLNVKATYNRFSKVANLRNMRAEECAALIMREAGINNVRIEGVGGKLTDHYSPNEKVLRLSENVMGSTSVAALGVAAHECGHAIQDKESYSLLGLRSAAVPLAKFGSTLSWPVILIGMLLGYMNIARFGVVLFSFVVIFQLITLPVEFDASRRAMRVLESRGILEGAELQGAGKVLTAAALTYVAALFTTILQLLRLILIVSGKGGRKRR